MKTLTATEAARRFADLLNAVERDGESFVITRRGRPVARMAPAASGTGKAFKELVRSHKPDKSWAGELRELRELLAIEELRWRD